MPEDSKDKEKYLSQILRTLSNFLIKNDKFEEALGCCQAGIYISLMRTSGKELPDLFCNKAYCLLKMGDIDSCENLLHQAYFAHTMLHKKEKADEVIEKVKMIFGNRPVPKFKIQ